MLPKKTRSFHSPIFCLLTPLTLDIPRQCSLRGAQVFAIRGGDYKTPFKKLLA